MTHDQACNEHIRALVEQARRVSDRGGSFRVRVLLEMVSIELDRQQAAAQPVKQRMRA
ncbi:hypothetical protein [Methylobacterium brachythecii]|uniref:Uncharacterized protein n=1 Tax=Methylobacterium brachythecii TaxID=1176177 RepID=A0A7W6F990_9HYPH|nr:hypothetical protein [Methylobacterium brachythecii]MBB3905283.1 hypothetical protein [Methylobacterium brachythecii]GLS45944.1 hypothetical protein GCM10007884_39350 [Methylobacterium brachythecii]